MNISLFHTTYSRFQALEIIREQAFQDAIDDSRCLPFSYCRQLADSTYEFYLKQTNVCLEIELTRLSGDIATVTDF